MALHYMFRRPIADIIDVFTLIVAEIEENGTLGVKDGLGQRAVNSFILPLSRHKCYFARFESPVEVFL